MELNDNLLKNLPTEDRQETGYSEAPADNAKKARTTAKKKPSKYYEKLKRERQQWSAIKKKARKTKQRDIIYTRRLGFMEVILDRLHYNWNDVSKMSGKSTQQLSWHRFKDDCYLQTAMECMAAIGIRITPRFDTSEMKKGYSTDTFNLTMDFSEPPAKRTKSKPDRTMDKLLSENGALAFIARHYYTTNLTMTDYARKIGTNITNFRSWLEQDDIKISKLYEIADAFGMKLEWKADKIDDENTETPEAAEKP